ncbi:hypothetical protein O0L34_g15371 [Tuta absoluta]|nr:hypothetical protein O0L34_g15371 [Tuta absoluta]
MNEMNMDVGDSDDEVVICEQYDLIVPDDDDTDDMSNSTNNSLTTPKQTMHQPVIATNQHNVFADEAKRIPIDKNTVELLCKYFGVDFNPQCSLQHIRQIIKDRTRMHTKTSERQCAIAGMKHHRYRRIVIKFLPNWFQIYHVITLIRLMSSFNVNIPTYWVQIIQAEKKTRTHKFNPEHSNKYLIDFLYVKDCTQLFYDLQGLQCFNNNIRVNAIYDMTLKHMPKPKSIKKALNCIKQFRHDQGMWCPITEGMVEIHDSEENSSQSYSFPLLADIQNNYIERNYPEFQQNEKNEYSIVNDYCRTVVMDKIPMMWGKYHIHKLISDIFSQKMEFHTSILDENNDNTVKYLVKFATHAQAAKVCTALNGFFIENKKLQVRFERGHGFDKRHSSHAKMLVSGASTGNCQSRRIKRSPILLPTTSAVPDKVPSIMENKMPKPPLLPTPQINYNSNASRNPYFVPQSPRFPAPNLTPYFAPRNPYFALETPRFQSNSIPQNQDWPRHNKMSPGKVTKPRKAKPEPQLLKPKQHRIVKKEEVPLTSGSQERQPHIHIQPIKKEIKQDIVIKEEQGHLTKDHLIRNILLGTVVKEDPDNAPCHNSQPITKEIKQEIVVKEEQGLPTSIKECLIRNILLGTVIKEELNDTPH